MYKINLIDKSFEGQPCSVWNQPAPTHFRYVRDHLDWDNGITLFTDAYILNRVVDTVRSRIKIGWLREPACLWPTNYAKAPYVMHKFDFILTYHQPLLEAYPDKFKFCPYGGTWIPKAQWGIRPKSKDISFLVGSKMSTEGHRLRHEVYKVLVDSGLDKQVDFYGVHGQPVNYSWQTKVKVLADHRYSIIIENCREDNYFDEMLLDCFALGTIPLYCGCPNIGKFFDDRGVYSFSDIKGLGEIMNHYTYPATYTVTSQPIIRNLNRLADYAITEDWLWEHVLKELV